MNKDSVAIVTGANSGLGKAASIELAKMGAAVVMLCRDRARGEAAVNEVRKASGSNSAELMICDLGSRRSIGNFIKEFKSKYSHLDILLNNAGVMLPKRTETIDGYESQFGINYLGHFQLTNGLLDILTSSAPSRIINVSSGAHKAGRIYFNDVNLKNNYSSFKAYAQSKLALIMFTYELSEKLKGTGVTVNCLHPGASATGIGISRDSNKNSFGSFILNMFFQTPEEGAKTAVYLATSSDVEGVTGKYYYRKKPIPSSKSSYEKTNIKRLWELSERMIR